MLLWAERARTDSSPPELAITCKGLCPMLPVEPNTTILFAAGLMDRMSFLVERSLECGSVARNLVSFECESIRPSRQEGRTLPQRARIVGQAAIASNMLYTGHATEQHDFITPLWRVFKKTVLSGTIRLTFRDNWRKSITSVIALRDRMTALKIEPLSAEKTATFDAPSGQAEWIAQLRRYSGTRGQHSRTGRRH